jgi:periplasmic nitrate reductase NapD
MSEVHIAGCVGYARPEFADSIVRAITAAGLAEVPRRDERGRLVILIERASSREVMDVIDAIRALEGVLAVHIAYQHCEAQSEMEKPQ